MIAEFGHFALIMALCVAIAQAVFPLAGASRGYLPWMRFGVPSAFAQLVCVGLAFAALTHGFIVSDFSLAVVAENSHTDKPLIYKISGVWGNHEGSMLLWVLILSVFGAAVAMFGRNLPPTLKARVLGVQSLVAIGFYLFLLLTSNPFARLFPAPINGRDLNPLLQDPGLAIHPPMLYLGYVGFSMAFSFAIAALLEGRVDAAWGRWVRPWTLAAWGFLTGGIALGSWWAYYELGWGGWWFWDPVENASFIPWLAGTALLHSATIVEKRDTMKGWTVFLAIVTFSMSLLGTFLVRSGVLTSVHAFATDPTRGVFILALLIVVIGGSFALFAWRGPALRNNGVFQPISREGALLFNNLIMTTAAATVLLGTLYPLFLDALEAGKISVGPPFFNQTFIPMMIPMVIAMAVGPLLGWKRADLGAALKKMWLAMLLALAAVAATWFVYGEGPVFGYIGFALAAWLGVGSLIELANRIKLGREPMGNSLARLGRLPRASWGMTLGHLGLAVAIAGMAGAGGWKLESIQSMRPGDSLTLGPYTYTFDGAREGQGPNYVFIQGQFTVTKADGSVFTVLQPENRRYPVRAMPTTEAAIETTWRGDLYAVIGDPEEEAGAFVTRIYWNPLVVWMWAGAIMMAFGALVSVSDRRYRVGAPERRRAATSASAQPAE